MAAERAGDGLWQWRLLLVGTRSVTKILDKNLEAGKV